MKQAQTRPPVDAPPGTGGGTSWAAVVESGGGGCAKKARRFAAVVRKNARRDPCAGTGATLTSRSPNRLAWHSWRVQPGQIKSGSLRCRRYEKFSTRTSRFGYKRLGARRSAQVGLNEGTAERPLTIRRRHMAGMALAALSVNRLASPGSPRGAMRLRRAASSATTTAASRTLNEPAYAQLWWYD